MRLFFRMWRVSHYVVTRFQSINSPKADWPPHWVVEPRLVDPRQEMRGERAFLQEGSGFLPLGILIHICETCVREHVQKPEEGFRVPRCHSPPYFLGMVPLTEPEASWWLSSCSNSSVSPSHNTGTHNITSNLVYRFLHLNSCLHPCSLGAVTHWAASSAPGLDNF